MNGSGSFAERCPWCGDAPDYVAYHDHEWGRPETDARALFEKLALDGFQAGLSWLTILRKREGFRRRLDGFAPHRLARWGEAEIAAALADPAIVRSRAKLEASVGNARAFLEIDAAEGFAPFLWSFVDFRPRQNAPARQADVPAETAESRAMSRALRARGFRFCGPVICYAFMQATGMVNDHLAACPARAPCAAEAARVRFGA